MLTFYYICPTQTWPHDYEKLLHIFFLSLLTIQSSLGAGTSMLSFIVYKDGTGQEHFKCIQQKKDETPQIAAYRGLKAIHDADNKTENFHLLSGKKWTIAPCSADGTKPPLPNISFGVDFYALKDLKVFFKDKKEPGTNIKLSTAKKEAKKDYPLLKKAFDVYLEEHSSSWFSLQNGLIVLLIVGVVGYFLMITSDTEDESEKKEKTNQRTLKA